MPSVLVVCPDATLRDTLVAGLAQLGLPVEGAADLDAALDHPDSGAVRVLLACPELLEAEELDFLTRFNVRAGTEARLIALTDIAEPARKKAIGRHGAVLLERPLVDHGSMAAQVRRLLAAEDVRRPAPSGLGRMKVERISLDDGTTNAPVDAGGTAPMVLLVDDEEDVRSFFSTLLEQRGYRVHAVSNATSALRYLGKEPVHVIISDIDMPQMDGFELKYALRESPIPFIAIAGDSSAERQQLAKELGMVALVPKPIQVKPFCALVRGAAERAVGR